MKAWQSLIAESGVTVAGFSTTLLPPAMAGPSLWATMRMRTERIVSTNSECGPLKE